MQTVFFVCFWVGVAITGINALLSLIFGIFDFGIDIDLDIDLGDFDLGAFLPLSPTLILLGMIIFGGTGMILYDGFPLALVVILALLIALAVTVLIKRFIVTPLRKISNTESGANDDYIGMTAHVSDAILDGEYGKITLTYDGNTVSCPAVSEDGKAIGAGEQVVILSRHSNSFVVERLTEVK